MENIIYTAWGCWEWRLGHFKTGYAKFSVGRRQDRLAHRWSCVFFKGGIPAGMEPDHLCRNRGCVNPSHLDLVPHRVNAQRGLTGLVTGARQRRKTHCRNGHPYSGENLYVYPNGERGCRACNRQAQQAYIERKKTRS